MENEIRAAACALESCPEPTEIDPYALLNKLRAVQERGEPLHPWDQAFLSAFNEEIGLGLPGQEALGVAFCSTEQTEGPRPTGIRYG